MKNTEKASSCHRDTLIPDQKQNYFTSELAQALISANIPVEKVNNPVSRKFLEKHIKTSIPIASALRMNYVDISEISEMKFKIIKFRSELTKQQMPEKDT